MVVHAMRSIMEHTSIIHVSVLLDLKVHIAKVSNEPAVMNLRLCTYGYGPMVTGQWLRANGYVPMVTGQWLRANGYGPMVFIIIFQTYQLNESLQYKITQSLSCNKRILLLKLALLS